MNWRLVAITLGCACVLGLGAAIASHYIGRDTARQTPLFVTTAQKTDPRPSWPPSGGSVAFNGEMIALLTMGASVSAPSREPARAQRRYIAEEEAEPPRHMSRQERRRAQQEERARLREERIQARDARAQAYEDRSREGRARTRHRRAGGDDDSVEIRGRDRRGVRSEPVEREAFEDRPRVYAPAPFGPFRN